MHELRQARRAPLEGLPGAQGERRPEEDPRRSRARTLLLQSALPWSRRPHRHVC